MPETSGAMIRYPFTAEEDGTGKIFVQFLDFPEGITEGTTLKEAIKNAQEVLDLLVEVYADEGTVLPAASPVGDLPFSVATCRISNE